MAFVKNKNQQASMFNPIYGLTERETRILKKSWAHEFREVIFPAINEERFSVLYSENDATRPNTPVNIIIGTLLIKDMLGLTDEEMVEYVTFSTQGQYALHTESFTEQPISDRTLSRFRERALKYEIETGNDLIKEEIKSLASVIKIKLDVTSKIQRIDSSMISAACRRLARLSIMFLTVRGMAELIKSTGEANEYGDILAKYYKNDESDDITYRVKGEEVRNKMAEVLADAIMILESAGEKYGGTAEYGRLQRMVNDQSKPGDDGNRELKAGKEILPTSMQTPYDDECTYRQKAGTQNVGYVLNVVESYGETANVIDDYDFQQNIYSDEQFAEDVLNSKSDGGGETEIIITDGAYCSTTTLNIAEDKQIDLAATSMAGGVLDDFVLGFTIDEETGKILECPAGHKPNNSVYKNKTHIGYYRDWLCENCRYCDRCPGRFQKKLAKIEVTDAALKKALYVRRRENDENLARYTKIRNGVENVFSVLKRRYQINHIPVRGKLRKKMWTGFKIGAMNVMTLVNSRRNE